MTMRLRQAGPEMVAFGCSPAYELLRSLHVLSDVKHHPLHISWALRSRERLTPRLKDELEAFAFWYRDRPLILPEIWRQADSRTWEEELSALHEAPIDHFVDPFLHSAALRNGLGPRIPIHRFQGALRDEAITQVEARNPASVSVLRELTADPERCRERFAQFLDDYWQICIAPDWPSMQAQLKNDIARRGRAASRRGLAAMLAELSPHIHGDDDGIVIRPPGREDAEPLEITLAPGDQILLVPSHFVWPELTALALRDRHQTILITYAVDGMSEQGKAPVPPERLLKLLRSAGDPTRLQVLRLLAGRPRSTREIAGLIGLTEAAISKHLKLLQDAGWVAPRRRSYYVYYRLEREAAEGLSRGLAELLG